MKTFFCKLIPPRPTFAQDMSEAEAKLMQEHAVYWRGCMEKGQVVAFGLVADPAGAYGIVIVEVDDDSGIRTLTANEPTIQSGRGFRFDLYAPRRGAPLSGRRLTSA